MFLVKMSGRCRLVDSFLCWRDFVCGLGGRLERIIATEFPCVLNFDWFLWFHDAIISIKFYSLRYFTIAPSLSLFPVQWLTHAWCRIDCQCPGHECRRRDKMTYVRLFKTWSLRYIKGRYPGGTEIRWRIYVIPVQNISYLHLSCTTVSYWWWC